MKYYGIQNEVKAYINRLQIENGISVSPSTVKTINDRVESLKRSGDWSRFSLGFNDTDGDAYLARAGVTNPLGRCEVLWFTRGMKALGLWQNMVAWAMRSYQNVGTGSTVYSIGGLGVLNGTMVNSPMWSVDGIVNNANSWISSSSTTYRNNHTILTVIRHNSSSISQRNTNYGPDGSRTMTQTDAVVINSNVTGSNTWYSYNSNQLSLSAFSMLGYSQTNAALLDATYNSSSTTASNSPVSVSSGATTSVQWFSQSSGFGVIGVGAVGIFINRETSRSERTNIYNLYKSTLGSNLGLP